MSVLAGSISGAMEYHLQGTRLLRAEAHSACDCSHPGILPPDRALATSSVRLSYPSCQPVSRNGARPIILRNVPYMIFFAAQIERWLA